VESVEVAVVEVAANHPTFRFPSVVEAAVVIPDRVVLFATVSPPPVIETPPDAVIPAVCVVVAVTVSWSVLASPMKVFERRPMSFLKVEVEFTVRRSVFAVPMKKSSMTPARWRVEEAETVRSEVEAEFPILKLVVVPSLKEVPPALFTEKSVVEAEFAISKAKVEEATPACDQIVRFE